MASAHVKHILRACDDPYSSEYQFSKHTRHLIKGYILCPLPSFWFTFGLYLHPGFQGCFFLLFLLNPGFSLWVLFSLLLLEVTHSPSLFVNYLSTKTFTQSVITKASETALLFC